LVIAAEVDVPFGRFRFCTTHLVPLWIVVQNPTLLESCYTETRVGVCDLSLSENAATTIEHKVPQAAFQSSMLPNTGLVT
jgi:hypothetical protein